MDGYALLAGPSGRRLRIVGESRAGAPSGHALSDGEAIRVSTGAAIPPGADAVIPQEDVDRADGADGVIATRRTAPPEPMSAAPARTCAPARSCCPPASGSARCSSAPRSPPAPAPSRSPRRPRVAVLSTGDELRAPGEPLGPGEIHNSNAPMLTGLSLDAGATPGPPIVCPTTARRRSTGSPRRSTQPTW